MDSDPEGPLCELLFFFLSAIFQALDEEQEEMAKDQVEGVCVCVCGCMCVSVCVCVGK